MKPQANRRYVIAAAAGLTLSAAGVAFVTKEEGSRNRAYLDTVQVWTICVGHTGMASGQRRVRPHDYKTSAECEALLAQDARVFERAVWRCIKHPITQQQFDTLVSISFNIGEVAFCASTLVRKLNAGDCHGAASEFSRWIKGGRGLKFRRARERKLFEEDCE
jgi:lysozyme